MYIRFESRVLDIEARCNQGVFCAVSDFRYHNPHLEDIWQVAEIRRLLDWFTENLEAPSRFYYRPCRKAEVSGVCWFRTSADTFISEARYLAWLLCDLGYQVVEKRSDQPGRVLWEDAHQIVAVARL